MLQQAGLFVGVVQFLVSMCLTADSIMRLIAVKVAVVQRSSLSSSLAANPLTPLQQPLQGGEAAAPSIFSPPLGIEPLVGTSVSASEEHDTEGTSPKDSVPTPEDLDYAGTIAAVLGPRAEVLLLFSIVVSSYGSNIAYILYIAENLTRFLPHCGLLEWHWAMLCLVPWLLLAGADDVKFLAPYGVLGLVCAAPREPSV